MNKNYNDYSKLFNVKNSRSRFFEKKSQNLTLPLNSTFPTPSCKEVPGSKTLLLKRSKAELKRS
jgi:hypothetical protein